MKRGNVVRVDNISRPNTFSIGKRMINISSNPAYNIKEGSSLDTQLSNITRRINQLTDENSVLRAKMKPYLVRDSKLHVEAPTEDSFLMATDQINKNTNALKILLRERSALEEQARYNMNDFVSDRSGKQVEILKPYQPEDLNYVSLKPKFALEAIPPRGLTDYRPTLRPIFDVNVADDIRYTTIAELGQMAVPMDLSGLLSKLEIKKPDQKKEEKPKFEKQKLSDVEASWVMENIDKLRPSELMSYAQKLGLTQKTDVNDFSSKDDMNFWRRRIYHAVAGKSREQQKQEEEDLKRKADEEAKRKAEEEKNKWDDNWDWARGYNRTPAEPPKYEPPTYDRGDRYLP